MQRSSSSSWVRGVVGMFDDQGIDSAALLRAAGIPAERLRQPSERFSADEVSRLWALAVEWSGNPALGLDRAVTARHASFDAIGFAMLACPTLHDGLRTLSRYLAVVSDVATFELLPAPGGRWLHFGGTGFSLPVPRQRYAWGLLSLVTLSEWLTRRSIVPLAAEFRFPRPPEAKVYDHAFGCPLRFSQPENRLLLAAADLEAVIPSRDEGLRALHEQVLQARLARLARPRISARVTEEIMRRLRDGEPRRDEIAAALALADRTLQRRLHAENTSFQQLLDAARRELARNYLADDRYALQQVGHQLGFVDNSNFVRACRRWFGQPPGQYRDALHAHGPADGLA